jgi:phage terminase large subunit-like protein
MAGRGFGKTRTGSEWISERVETGKMRSGLLIGKNPRDVRDYMLYGESGLLSVGPLEKRPTYEPSKLLLTWPNGAQAIVRSGEDKDVRGPNLDTAWFDEMAAWQYPRETFEIAMLGLRAVRHGTATQAGVRCLVTTTPKPIGILKELVSASYVVVTGGTTYENLVNLDEQFQRLVVAKYEGTTLGQQELYALLLEEAEGALWTRELLNRTRVREMPCEAKRTVIAVDPAISKKQESNETGIIAVSRGTDDHGYTRADRSGRFSPEGWARRVVQAYEDFNADRVVAEANQGGDMVEHTLRTVAPNIPVRLVHASDGKRTRAEPVVSLFEQGRAHHVGLFEELEDQLCTWEPLGDMPSPDRLDAEVWGYTELFPVKPVVHASPGGVSQKNPWAIA